MEANLVGSRRRCEAVVLHLNRICSQAEKTSLGRRLITEGRLELPPYGAIDFNGFQWEENHGLDPYWSYEINNFRFLLYLLAYHAQSGDERALDFGLTAFSNWQAAYRDTGPGYSFRYIWHDVGAALRAEYLTVFLAYAFQAAPGWLQANAEWRVMVLDEIRRHAETLCLDSFYSAGTNHGVLQMKSLLMLSVLFSNAPDHRQAERWRETAVKRLSAELADSFTAEGIHIESSPGYHFYTFDKFLRITEEYPPAIIGREIALALEALAPKAFEYGARIVRPDGCLPIIGDTELRPAPEGIVEPFNHIQTHAWYLWSSTGGHKGRPAPGLNKVYPQSGYAIFRDCWLPVSEALHLVVKAGALSEYHYQGDEGHLVLYAYGEDWLIDSGLYNYDLLNPTVKYFRSRGAHNLPLFKPWVEYPPELRDRFRLWKIAAYDESDERPFVEMDLRLLKNIRHVRRVSYVPAEKTVEVEDRFECADLMERELSLCWHVPGDKVVKIDSGLAVAIDGRKERRLVLSFSGARPFEIECLRGRSDDQIYSLTSPQLNVIEESQVLKVKFWLKGLLSVVSRFQFMGEKTGQ